MFNMKNNIIRKFEYGFDDSMGVDLKWILFIYCMHTVCPGRLFLFSVEGQPLWSKKSPGATTLPDDHEQQPENNLYHNTKKRKKERKKKKKKQKGAVHPPIEISVTYQARSLVVSNLRRKAKVPGSSTASPSSSLPLPLLFCESWMFVKKPR